MKKIFVVLAGVMLMASMAFAATGESDQVRVDPVGLYGYQDITLPATTRIKVNSDGKVETTATLSGDITIGEVDQGGKGTEAWLVDGSAVTQPVSGTVTANAGTNLNTSALALETGGNLATIAGDTTSIDGKITACNTGAVVVASGDITETNSGSIKTAVETIDNAISGNEMQVDVVTQPALSSTTDSVKVEGGNTADVKVTLDSESVAVTGTFWQTTQPISGTVTANAGTNLNTSALALDATLDNLTIAQNADLGTNTQALIGGSVTTGYPSYTTAKIQPLSLATDGTLRVRNDMNPCASTASGQKVVTTHGTEVALASTTAILSVTVKAKHANAGMIYIGANGVSSTTGYVLDAGETVTMDVDDLADVYIDSDNDGEGVSFIYVVK